PYAVRGGPGTMLWPGRAVLRAIVEEARAQGTDKILFGTPWPLVLLGPQLRSAGLRYSVIVHGAELVVPGAIPLLRSRMAAALGAADLLLPVSDYTGAAVVSLLQRMHVAVPRMERLRARVDTDRFHPNASDEAVLRRYGVQPDSKVVLCFGRLVARKGVDRLIRALPQMANEVPNVVLVVGGTGPEEKRLRKLAATTGASVRFAGRVPDADAPALYASADVFALPVVDRWFGLEIEGLGVVLLEASACETPCVTGRSGGTPEAVLDGHTGFVVDASSRDDLAARIIELLRNDGLRAMMGSAARAHVQENFSAELPPQPLLDWLA
ncbi:MAG: glycosyltransferase family 4 protein, partial [Actinomycetota bacterium]|nr:glycosyltransferase family 4 protein [Actinomycetota bacterium]